MKRIPTTVAMAVGLAFAGSALAWNGSGNRYEEARFDWARVVRVDPVVERSRVPVADRYCYDEPVEVYEPGYRTHRNGGTVAGALIGGALGNLAGKGDGRKAATIAGALIGGSIGHDSDRRHGDGYRDGRYATAYEQRCEQRTSWRGSDEIVGYDVSYRYDGRLYHTQMNYNPGSRIRVRVDQDVTPAG
ncbi:MAG: glycine zipper 2TM domain-containing protein [Tahibacter sp.]